MVASNVVGSILGVPVPFVLAWAIAAPATAGLPRSEGTPRSFKQNGPLARESGGDVRDVRVSPDGLWAVYQAPQDSQEPGLYSVRVDGSRSATRLVPPGTAYFRFEVSSSRVVYTDLDDLYSVPIDGSRPPVAVLPPEPQREIERLRVTPDGRRIVYLAVTPSSGGWGLCSAQADGDKGPVRLSPAPLAGLIWNFVLSPDGARVVYVANQVPGVLELFSVPIDGTSAAVRLDSGGGTVDYRGIAISPRGDRVVFRTDGLYSAPIDGSSPAVQLNGALVAGGAVRSYAVSPDGARVVYMADQESDNREELYSVPIDAGAPPVRLNGALSQAGDVERFTISPDGARVLYFASEDGNASRELRCAPIDGSAPSLALFPQTYLGEWPEFSPDGRHVVYAYYDRVVTDLYGVSLADGQGIRLTSGAPNGHPYSGFRIAADGTVVYLEYFGATFELRKAPLDGSSAPARLAGPFATGGPYSSSGYMTLCDLDRVLLHLDVGTGTDELFSIPVAGGRELLRLNRPLVRRPIVADVSAMLLGPEGNRAVFTVRVGVDKEGHDELFSVRLGPRPQAIELFARPRKRVYDPALSADGRRVVFRAGNDEYYELFSVPADGRGPAVQLNDPATSRSGVGAFQLSPDGERAVFVAYQDDGSELYAVPLAGGAEIELSGELVEGGGVSSFQVTSDGRVVYRADQRVEGVVELFSVPIDGSAAPLVLNGSLAPGGDVQHDFQLAPDQRTLVYAADQEEDGVVALYRVPADGSTPPVRLDRAPIPGGNVLSGFRISPDGRWLVYRADHELDERFELHALALDGAGGPLKLSGALVAGGDVQPDFALDPLGARVAYRADGEVDERFELYSSALDGTTGPVRISGALVAGGDVLGAGGTPALRISPDGTRVVYRADAVADERIELFSAPIDGSTRPISIAGPLPAGADVLERFELTPDGQSAVYAADALANDVYELFAAPLLRAKEARRLNGGLVSGGDAAVVRYWNSPEAVFALTPGGEALVYIADQDTDEVHELYLSPLERPPRAPLAAPEPR